MLCMVNIILGAETWTISKSLLFSLYAFELLIYRSHFFAEHLELQIIEKDGKGREEVTQCKIRKLHAVRV